MSSRSTLDMAMGRWEEILSNIGFTSQDLDKKNKPCPVRGDGVDRFRFDNKNGDGRFFCHCVQHKVCGTGIDLVQCKMGLRTWAEAAKEVDEIIGRIPDKPKKKDRSQMTYAETLLKSSITSTASAYLASRHLEIAPALRFIRSVSYKHNDVTAEGLQAMLSPITKDGKFVSAHLTYLKNGKKADVPVAKLNFGDGWSGGACELYPVDGPILGIAEGVETAIAAKMMNLHPVWSALHTAGMKAWMPPEGIEEVIIYGDNDVNFAGHAAAYTLAHRLTGGQHGKLRVSVLIPPKVDTDWADVWLEMCLKQG